MAAESEEDFIEAAREGRQQFNRQLVGILTAEQRARYEEMIAARREASPDR